MTHWASAFYRRSGGYTSYAKTATRPSPAHVITAAAKRLIDDRQRVNLPHGVDYRGLVHFCSETGTSGVRVRITLRQASELLQVAEELLANFRKRLEPTEVNAIEWLQRFMR